MHIPESEGPSEQASLDSSTSAWFLVVSCDEEWKVRLE